MVNQALHFVMAVAMAVMAWPWGAALPTIGPMVFFFVAYAWFVAIACTPICAGHRVAGVYHALMMLAMSWMYAVMNGHVLPGQAASAGTAVPSGKASGGAGHAGMNMPGMDMSAHTAAADNAGSGYPPYIDTGIGAGTLLFAFAAAYWLGRYLAVRMDREPSDAGQPLWFLCQSMMAAGMAIMFGVML